MTQRSFKILLRATVFFLNAIVIGITWFSTHVSWQAYHQSALTSTHNLSLALEREIAGVFNSIDLSLSTLADEYQEESHYKNEKVWNRLFAQQRAHLPLLSGLRGVNAEGVVVWGLKPNDPKGVSVAERDYFLQHKTMADCGLIISSPLLSGISQQWSLVLSRRINNQDGSFAGIVAASLPLASLSERFTTLKIGNTGSIAIRDGRLKLILRQPELPGGGQIGTTEMGSEFKQAYALNPHQGSFISEKEALDGIRRYYTYRHNPEYDFYINVGVGKDEHFAIWQKDTKRSVGFAILFLLVTTILAFRFQKIWQAHAENEATLRSIFDQAAVGVALIDSKTGQFIRINKFYCDMLGYSEAEMLNSSFMDITHPEDLKPDLDNMSKLKAGEIRHFSMEKRYFHKNGEVVWVSLEVSPNWEKGQAPTTHIAVVKDITDKKQADEEIYNLAFFDVMTKLPNRRLLIDRMKQSMALGSRNIGYLAILFLDMDNFKRLNDSLGHHIGDLFLIETARRLESCVRRGDTIARLGGDEFIVLLEQLSENILEAAAAADNIAKKIISLLNKPYYLEDTEYMSSTSIGIALFRGDELEVEEVLKRADMAMYQAKSSGHNVIAFFDPEAQKMPSGQGPKPSW